eukprot:m.382129 g.382129  ORF g.382129 m.382129 type:complete len:282 (+) comp16718_c0_seq22:253-1098(+)
MDHQREQFEPLLHQPRTKVKATSVPKFDQTHLIGVEGVYHKHDPAPVLRGGNGCYSSENSVNKACGSPSVVRVRAKLRHLRRVPNCRADCLAPERRPGPRHRRRQRHFMPHSKCEPFWTKTVVRVSPRCTHSLCHQCQSKGGCSICDPGIRTHVHEVIAENLSLEKTGVKKEHITFTRETTKEKSDRITSEATAAALASAGPANNRFNVVSAPAAAQEEEEDEGIGGANRRVFFCDEEEVAHLHNEETKLAALLDPQSAETVSENARRLEYLLKGLISARD